MVKQIVKSQDAQHSQTNLVPLSCRGEPVREWNKHVETGCSSCPTPGPGRRDPLCMLSEGSQSCPCVSKWFKLECFYSKCTFHHLSVSPKTFNLKQTLITKVVSVV